MMYSETECTNRQCLYRAKYPNELFPGYEIGDRMFDACDKCGSQMKLVSRNASGY